MFVMSERYQINPTGLETFLTQEMKKRNMSIVAFARAAGIGRQTLHSYLKGSRPTIENCRKLAFYLGISFETIISLAYPDDIEGKVIEAFLSAYLSLPNEGQRIVEDTIFSVQRNLGERKG